MDLIIDFYKELDTLNLIIFWGIIIVIILLLIFSFILINKNKKLKKIVEKQNKYEEEIPIKKTELSQEAIYENKKELETPKVTEEPEKPKINQEDISKPIEIEKDFVAEEHVSVYQNNESVTSNVQEKSEQIKYNQINTTKNIEIPNKPYQRNVLREMSLSQTSPIGINRTNIKEDKKVEMIKDLEESLNDKNIEIETPREPEVKLEKKENVNETTKQELSSIKDNSYRKTEIKHDISPTSKHDNFTHEPTKTTVKVDTPEEKVNTHTSILENYQDISNETNDRKEKKSSEKYLEEVSRKLAEAEVPDEIERTSYEIKQEEDAIISYKELMEKKDSIQTIDEEEAVISIEELMNKANAKTEESQTESKLYNLSEEEANDNFIKELKQFRNDL